MNKKMPFNNNGTSPMDEVCGAVHRVYDPRRLVSQDASFPFRHRLFPNEAAHKKHLTNNNNNR